MTIAALILSSLVLALPRPVPPIPQRVEVRNERDVYIRDGRGARLVKRLGPAQAVQGAALVSPSTVFVAYSSDGAEAATVFALCEIGTSHERLIGELGATGQSRFSYNPSNDLVAFNWYDGLYVFSLGMARKSSGRGGVETLLVKVKECGDGRCFEPEWKGARIVFKDGDGRSQSVPVPARIAREARSR